jgi:hypothetical protein
MHDVYSSKAGFYDAVNAAKEFEPVRRAELDHSQLLA